MKNIFKSYIKLFIKSWVETAGTIIFLMIFTMLIMGMLSTPLQLSIKASSIKRDTVTWQEQRETDGKLSESFVEKFLTPSENGEQIEGKQTITEIENQEISLIFPENGWFSDDAITAIDTYLKSINDEAQNVCKEPSPGESNDECVENFIKSEKNNLVVKLFNSYKNYSDEKELVLSVESTTEGETKNLIKVGELFTPEGKEILDLHNRSLNTYIIEEILSQLSSIPGNSEFNYSTFYNISKNYTDANGKQYIYFISSFDSSNENKKDLNNIVLQEGRLPEKNNEILVNDAFLKKQNLSIGSSINLANGFPFTIVGTGVKYSTLSPVGFSSFYDSIDNYAQIFVRQDFFNYDSTDTFTFKNIFLNEEKNPSWEQTNASGKRFRFWTEEYMGDYNLNISLNQILNEEHGEYPPIFNSGSAVFKDMKSQSIIKNLTNLYIITWIYGVIGGILFILAFFFILFVLKKEINNTRRQLGVFKSLGYKTTELTWIFSIKTFITMIIAIGIGYALSVPFQIDSATKQFNTYVVFDYQTVYSNALFLIMLIAGVPLLFSLVSYLSIFRYLSEGALALLSTGPRKSNYDWIVLIAKIIFFPVLIYSLINWIILKSLKNRTFGFTFRMQHAFVATGKGKFALIMGLFAFSSFLFTLQLRAMPIIENMIDGAYNIYTPETNHFYSLKSISNIDIKENGLTKNVTKPDYKIDYVNITEQNYSSIDEYINANSSENQEYYYSSQASKLIKSAAELKKAILNLNNEIGNETISVALNFAMLLLPLETGAETLDELTSLINSGQTSEALLEILALISGIKEIDPNSMISIHPEKLRGLYLNDIAQYLCVSTPSNDTKDCTNIEEYRKLLSSNFNNQNSKKDVDLNFSDDFKTLIQTFVMTKEGINPFLSVNTVLFEGDKEVLMEILPFYIEGNSDVDIDASSLKLFDTTKEYGGDIRKLINFSNITDENINQLSEEHDDYINGIISYRLAKLINKNVGDVFEISIGNSGLKQKIKIVAINSNDTMLQNVYVDYKITMDKIGSALPQDEQYYFNDITSTKLASEGKIDFADIGGSIKTFKNLKDTFSFATSTETPWVGNLLDIFVRNIDTSQEDLGPFAEFQEIINQMKKEINAPKDTNFFMEPGVISLPILKSVIDELISKLTKSMLMYILIDIVLLTILLVVIMNIIISDSINIITIMRSLGYSNRQINWMVMGKYVTGAFISFIFAFIASIGVWYIIQTIVWDKFKILIAIPDLPWIPFVSILVLGAIIYIGWLAAMVQIKKRPLTLLVS